MVVVGFHWFCLNQCGLCRRWLCLGATGSSHYGLWRPGEDGVGGVLRASDSCKGEVVVAPPSPRRRCWADAALVVGLGLYKYLPMAPRWGFGLCRASSASDVVETKGGGHATAMAESVRLACC
jgi:hypothetical protein